MRSTLTLLCLLCSCTGTTIDPCASVDCGGNGVCATAAGAARCVCNDGFVSNGATCEPAPRPCEGVTCGGHGACAITASGPTCLCSAGFHVEGTTCLANVVGDECAGVTCGGRGTCVVVIDSTGRAPQCLCGAGADPMGTTTCVARVTPCDGVTCSGRGTCAVSGAQAICLCGAGFHAVGLGCEADVADAECQGVTCSGHGTCVVVAGTTRAPQCLCDSGFRATSATTCLAEPNPCAGVTCSGHGSCAVSSGTALCVCAAGFHVGAALSCEPDVVGAECQGVTCGGRGACVVVAGPPRGPQCVCGAGSLAQSGTCVPAPDPCAGVTCGGHGTCAVSQGAAVCVCQSGFAAQGGTCVSQPNPCTGVACSGHGTCAVAQGAAVCVCDSGFHPNGALACEATVSSCTGVTCSGHGTCAIVNGSATCLCEESAGWYASGTQCVDPCAQVSCVGGFCVAPQGKPMCGCPSSFSSATSCVTTLEGGSVPGIQAEAMRRTADDGFITLGNLQNTTTAALQRFDGTFTASWQVPSAGQRLAGGGGLSQHTLVEAVDGGFVFGARDTSLMLVRTDAVGNQVWARVLPDAGTLYGVENAGTGYLVMGDLLQRLDDQGAVLWTRRAPSDVAYWTSARALTGGGWVLSGKSTGAIGRALATRVDAMGNVVWTRMLGLPSSRGLGFSVVPVGNDVIVAANVDNDGQVVRFDGNGNVLWVRRFGGSEDDRLVHLESTAQGGVVVSGETRSFNNSQGARSSAWLVALDGAGRLLWNGLYGSGTNSRFVGHAVMPDGSVKAAGVSLGSDGRFRTWGLRVDGATGAVIP